MRELTRGPATAMAATRFRSGTGVFVAVVKEDAHRRLSDMEAVA